MSKQKDYSIQIDRCLSLLEEWTSTTEQIKKLNDKKEQLNFAVYFLLKNKVLTNAEISKKIGGNFYYPYKILERVEKRLKRNGGDTK